MLRRKNVGKKWEKKERAFGTVSYFFCDDNVPQKPFDNRLVFRLGTRPRNGRRFRNDALWQFAPIQYYRRESELPFNILSTVFFFYWPLMLSTTFLEHHIMVLCQIDWPTGLKLKNGITFRIDIKHNSTCSQYQQVELSEKLNTFSCQKYLTSA